MKVLFLYGRLNDKKRDVQNVNIRVYHGDLDYRGSLKFEVNKKDWDFEKRDITDLTKGSRTFEESQYLSDLKRDLYNIRLTFENEFRKQKRAGKVWNKEEWGYWCPSVIDLALGGEKEERFRLIDKMEEYVQHLQLRGAEPGTIRGWKGKIQAVKKFQESRKKVIYTEEVDMAFWYELKKYCEQKGIKLNTFGDYIKKIRSTIFHFRSLSSDFKYSPQIDHKDFKAPYEPRVGVILSPSEIDKIYSFEGSKELVNISRLAFIQYMMCWRVSDLKKELKAYQEGQIEIHYNNELNQNEWIFKEKKKSKLGAIGVPINKRALKVIQEDAIDLSILENENDYNKLIKQLFKAIGVKDSDKASNQDLRKSFCTNQYTAGHSLQDIMQHSGHRTESSLLVYINMRGRSRKTNISLD